MQYLGRALSVDIYCQLLVNLCFMTNALPNPFMQELEKHSVAFVGQARLLAAWDSAVLSNRHALLDVEQELRAVHAGQEALERQLGMIETHQKVGPDVW